MTWFVGLSLAYVAGAISAVLVLAFVNVGGSVGEELEKRELKALRTRRRKKNGSPTLA